MAWYIRSVFTAGMPQTTASIARRCSAVRVSCSGVSGVISFPRERKLQVHAQEHLELRLPRAVIRDGELRLGERVDGGAAGPQPDFAQTRADGNDPRVLGEREVPGRARSEVPALRQVVVEQRLHAEVVLRIAVVVAGKRVLPRHQRAGDAEASRRRGDEGE